MTGRARPLAAVVGAATFAGTWLSLGLRAEGYSPRRDPVSRLARVGARTRPAMTAGFVAYAVGTAAFVPVLYAHSKRAGFVTAANAASMAALAALPLGAPGGDTPHVIAAGSAYATLTLAPLLAATEGRRRSVSRVLGAATGLCLGASVASRQSTGGWQRAGLSIGQGWIVACALAALLDPEASEVPTSSPP